jgi:hypothetical protein
MLNHEQIVLLGGVVAMTKKYLNKAEYQELGHLLTQLEMMPPVDQVQDFVHGWPAPGSGYQARRGAIKARIARLEVIAVNRAEDAL